jgi:hypothetical protein
MAYTTVKGDARKRQDVCSSTLLLAAVRLKVPEATALHYLVG